MSNNAELHSARDLMIVYGYVDWRNFVGVIKRAEGIIKHQCLKGDIVESTRVVTTGKGARRTILDYLIDDDAMNIVQFISASYKLNNTYMIRNETVVLQLVEKYCHKNGIQFEYQYRSGGFIFDCVVDYSLLIEIDEPHHTPSGRQRTIDNDKTAYAESIGCSIYRVTLDMDIIDIILYINENVC